MGRPLGEGVRGLGDELRPRVGAAAATGFLCLYSQFGLSHTSLSRSRKHSNSDLGLEFERPLPSFPLPSPFFPFLSGAAAAGFSEASA